LDIGEHGRLDKVRSISNTLAPANQFRAITPARFDVAHDFIELRLIDLGALLRLGIGRVAHSALSGASAAPFHELVDPAIVDQFIASKASLIVVHEFAHRDVASRPLSHVLTQGVVFNTYVVLLTLRHKVVVLS
jgi:hypothetical protein